MRYPYILHTDFPSYRQKTAFEIRSGSDHHICDCRTHDIALYASANKKQNNKPAGAPLGAAPAIDRPAEAETEKCGTIYR
jgi:hypothetical protein